jgi:hypothetical protein
MYWTNGGYNNVIQGFSWELRLFQSYRKSGGWAQLTTVAQQLARGPEFRMRHVESLGTRVNLISIDNGDKRAVVSWRGDW